MSPLAEKYAKAGFNKEEADGLELAWIALDGKLLVGLKQAHTQRDQALHHVARRKCAEHIEAIQEVRAVAGFEE